MKEHILIGIDKRKNDSEEIKNGGKERKIIRKDKKKRKIEKLNNIISISFIQNTVYLRYNFFLQTSTYSAFLVTFLNSETPELRLDFDSNDVSAKNVSTCYHTEDDIISLSNADPNQLFISHFNIRSLNKNFDKFHLFSNRLNYEHSIIGLSETWLKKTSPSSLFTMDGFKLITKNRTSKKGGGVGFYVRNNLDYTLLEECSLMTETFESIFF